MNECAWFLSSNCLLLQCYITEKYASVILSKLLQVQQKYKIVCVHNKAKCILLSELFQQAKYLSQMLQTSWKPGRKWGYHIVTIHIQTWINPTLAQSSRLKLTHPNSSSPIWTYSHPSGLIYTHPDLSRLIKTLLDSSRLFQALPDSSRLI